VDGACQLLEKFFAKSHGQQGLSSYLSFLFESKYVITKEILKYSEKFMEGISSDQKGGIDTPLSTLGFTYHSDLNCHSRRADDMPFEPQDEKLNFTVIF
jgi:hypothetical protein